MRGSNKKRLLLLTLGDLFWWLRLFAVVYLIERLAGC
jgi:hypothetical protein